MRLIPCPIFRILHILSGLFRYWRLRIIITLCTSSAMMGPCRRESRLRESSQKTRRSNTSKSCSRPSRCWSRTTSCTGTSSPVIFCSTTGSSSWQTSGSASPWKTQRTWHRPCSVLLSTWPLKSSRVRYTPWRRTFGP